MLLPDLKKIQKQIKQLLLGEFYATYVLMVVLVLVAIIGLDYFFILPAELRFLLILGLVLVVFITGLKQYRAIIRAIPNELYLAQRIEALHTKAADKLAIAVELNHSQSEAKAKEQNVKEALPHTDSLAQAFTQAAVEQGVQSIKNTNLINNFKHM